MASQTASPTDRPRWCDRTGSSSTLIVGWAEELTVREGWNDSEVSSHRAAPTNTASQGATPREWIRRSLAPTGRGGTRQAQTTAAAAVFFVIAGWGVAQYPYLLGDHLRLADAAAPTPTLVAVTGIFVAAALTCIPSLGLLYLLHEKGALGA